MLTVSAYAKINLTLEVLGIYSDGYHEVATVLQEIDLKDTLFFEEHQDIKLKSPENLVLKAARLLQDAGKCNKGALISIEKGIPIAAGLGGSSSDAAATLRGLNEFWGLDFSVSELIGVASRVSADTAFFLYGGTALGEGRGERITPLPPFVPSSVVLFRPPVSVSPNKTESLYASLNPSHFTDGQFSKKMIGLLRQEGDVCHTSLFNVFEKVAFTTFPGLEGYWQRFSDLGAGNIHLAGSGPTLFTLVGDKYQGDELYQCLRKEGLEAYLVQTKARH